MTGEDGRELRAYLEDRFDRVDGRLDGMDERFDDIEVRLDGMEERFDGLEARVEENTMELRKLGILVERNHRLIETVAEGVTSVERGLGELRRDMQSGFRAQRELLDSFAGHSESRDDDLDRRVSTLERRVDRLEEGEGPG